MVPTSSYIGCVVQAATQYEAALTAYGQALASAQRHNVSSTAATLFIEERTAECYAALSDWEGLRLRLASLEVGH